MTSLRQLATQIACAFSEEFFGFPGADGRTVVPLDQAGLIASGRMDLWSDWPDQPEDTQRLVGQFLRLRHNELGSPRRFLEAARKLRHDQNSPYQVPDEIPDNAVTYVIARHGQRPLELAQRLLEEAETKYLQGRRPLPVAGPGKYRFGWHGESTVKLPITVHGATVAPVVLDTAGKVDDVKVSPAELKALANHLAQVSGSSPWQSGIIEELFDKLRDVDDLPVTELLLRAGGIRLLNAPTGVGKSVLTRLLAVHLARQGVPVAIVVGTIHDALSTAEQIADEENTARRLTTSIEHDLAVLGTPARCVALVSPRRLEEKATQAAERGEWDRFDQLGYGCVLPALTVDGPPPAAPDEPCTSLRALPEPDQEETSSDKKGRQAKSDADQRYACPMLSACGRHRGFHNAAAADIIVTNHHNLIHGTVPIPVRVDGIDHSRMPVLEFLMRRCPVLIIDEIDLLQSNMFDAGARQLVLAASGGRQELPLAQLDTQRTMLMPAEDREVFPALSRTRFLADQFLNYILEQDLWLEADLDRPGSGWHVPGANDRMLLQALFGVEDDIDGIAPEIYEQFNALFPDTREVNGGTPPRKMRKVATLLRSVVSNDTGQDRIREVTHSLHRTLARRVRDKDLRRAVVNALLVRTWLGALHQSLTRLTFAVSSPGTELPAARVLADKLGNFVQHATIPYGPLGYLLFGFRVDKVSDPYPQGKLSVQAIAGDPHTTIAQLGGTVALSTAGVQRIVLGLSATAFFPGAAREHIKAEVTYAMTDAAPGAFTTRAGKALDEEFQAIHIGGRSESHKPDAIRELGKTLWDQHLDRHLRKLAETAPDRELCMLVGNSYKHAALLGAGIASHIGDPSWVAVVVPKDHRSSAVALPSGVVRVTVEDLEALPREYPNVKVCIAPLSLVARGLNILVPGDQRSALASVWVCVRPPTQLTDSAEMFASVNSHALDIGIPGPGPAAVLNKQRQAAFSRLYHILASDPRFSRLSRVLKAEAVAGMLVDLIQLAGRARRGGTPVELYLVDGAFHDAKFGSDLPGLLRFYYDNLTPASQRALSRIYGSTLVSWLDFAGIDHTSEDDNR
ncbi:ATP-dependent DNA helicase [Nocardia puris]|uniref:Helicase ATP-binding domain-containing protein n=1 Tax=Nocardia puris TaxID=208602 RepID=A0A366E3E9_9NOCA|nr:hypothetical protein [Nocardia puris]RBO96901.1 hypothetical protein DFR74_101920 [Nocardia puris]